MISVAVNDRQKLFALEYIKSGNAYRSAIQAGYKKNSAKDASKWINPEILKNPKENERKKYKPELRAYIDQMLEEKEKKLIADGDEVLKYLTSVLRGESQSEIVVIEGTGDGCSEARRFQKAPDERERLKAAELLGKRHALFSDKIQADIAIPVVISGGDDLED